MQWVNEGSPTLSIGGSINSGAGTYMLVIFASMFSTHLFSYVWKKRNIFKFCCNLLEMHQVR